MVLRFFVSQQYQGLLTIARKLSLRRKCNSTKSCVSREQSWKVEMMPVFVSIRFCFSFSFYKNAIMFTQISFFSFPVKLTLDVVLFCFLCLIAYMIRKIQFLVILFYNTEICHFPEIMKSLVRQYT